MPEDKKSKEPKTAEAGVSAPAPVAPAPAVTAPAVAASTPAPPPAVQPTEEPKIKFVMMKRITDGDGPHPIHPDEVENYRRGDWVVVEDAKK